MSKAFKIVGVTVLVGLVAAAVFGAVALADEPETAQGGRWAQIQDFAARMKSAFASKLGVQEEDLDTAWSDARADVVQQALEAGTITQEQADKMLEQESQFLGGGMMTPFGRGRRMPKRMPFGYDIMGQGLETVAEVLDTDVATLKTQLQEGKSIAEIAGDKVDDVKTALVTKATEAVNQAVENQQITQAQADTILANLAEQIDAMLNKTFMVPGDMSRPGFGDGGWLPRGRMPHGRFGRGDWPGSPPDAQPSESAETQTTSNL